MSSCCRGNEKDPNIEFFDIIEKATFALANRPAEGFVEDTTSNVRWGKLIKLQQLLSHIAIMTGKELK